MPQLQWSGRRAVAWGFALAFLVSAGDVRGQDSPAYELRRGVIADAARAAVYLPAPTDPTLTAGTTKIKAAHVTEVRNGVK